MGTSHPRNKACRICGLGTNTTGSDPCVYIADLLDLGEKILGDLAALMENNDIKKVIHNANFELSFISASQRRRLKFRNIFDVQLVFRISCQIVHIICELAR